MINLLSSNHFEKERLTRISHSKVRTGCLTCRTRHIKCDEGRPICLLCTKRGVVCEYRDTPDKRTRASRVAKRSVVGTQQGRAAPNTQNLNSRILASQVDLTWRERYFLDFFRRSTSLQCAGYFYDEFWERLVHQASEDQPAIRHAVIGMGSLNYHFAQSGTSQMRLGSGQRPFVEPFSLQQINKAIASLQQNLNDESMGRLRVETALVACVVLVSTLLFQEDAALAGRHLWSGYRLLEQYLISNGSKSLVAATITRAFGVIHLIWTLFTGAGSLVEDEPLPLLVPETFTEGGDDIQKANDLMVTLARISSVQSWSKSFSIGTASPDLNIDPNAVVSYIQCLPSQIQAHHALHIHRLTQRDLNALLILKLWAEILSVTATVETGLEPKEMIYDCYIEQFKRALQIAKELLMHDSSAPAFSVNIGVIPPLCFLALKCRDWVTRREAVILLRQWRRQEGIWSTDFVALVAQRVIEIESAGVDPADMIPESSRIKSIHVDAMTTKSQVRLWYHFFRDCPGEGCKHVQPWENELLSYVSGRFEILEFSRKM